MQAKEFAKDVVLLLKDSDTNVRDSAATALPKLGKQDLPGIIQILEAVLRSRPEERTTPRFLAHFLSGGELDIVTLMQWVGSPKTIPNKPSYDPEFYPIQRRISRKLTDSFQSNGFNPGFPDDGTR